MRVGTRANEGVCAREDNENGFVRLSYTLRNVSPRASEPDRITGGLALLVVTAFVDMVRRNLENESENRDEVGTSGSRSNPVTHIRVNTSTLSLVS